MVDLVAAQKRTSEISVVDDFRNKISNALRVRAQIKPTYLDTEQPDEYPKGLDDAFSEIWKGLETIQHMIHDKYHFDLSAIKKATADTHNLCRPFWDKMQVSEHKRKIVEVDTKEEFLHED